MTNPRTKQLLAALAAVAALTAAWWPAVPEHGRQATAPQAVAGLAGAGDEGGAADPDG